jgi:hypothetical protein
MHGVRLLAHLATVAFTLIAAPSWGRTFIIAHAPMRSGTVSSPQNFDTSIEIAYSDALVGPGTGSADVEVWMFNPDGTPVRAATGVDDLCAPCTFPMGSRTPKQTVRLDDLLTNGGGFPSDFIAPFVVVVTSGDAENVALQSVVVNSHSGPFEITMFDPGLHEVVAAGGSQQALVLPWIRESSGTTSSPNEFDTAIEMVYAAGLAGLPAGSGVTVDLFLFDDATGLALESATGAPVCDPYTVTLGPLASKQTMRIHNLIVDAGGFPAGFVGACGVIVTSGDTDHFVTRAFVTNSHTGAFEVSVLAYEPKMVADLPTDVATLPAGAGDLVRRLRNLPNPFNPGTTVAFTLATTADVSIDIYDANGRFVRALHRGHLDAGTHGLPWDGRDASGREAASGVYMAHVSANGTTNQHKLVLTR